MTSLRHLARNGRTIVTTIHQPRSSIFHLFDMLCLIAEGRTVYFGPAEDVSEHFSKLGFTTPKHFNVADYFIDVLSIDYRTEEKQKKSTTRVRYIADHFLEHEEPKLLQDVDEYDESHNVERFANFKQNSNSYLKEFQILARRAFTLMSRERQINLTRLGQTLFFSILLGLIWLNAGREDEPGSRRAVQGILFFIVINQ